MTNAEALKRIPAHRDGSPWTAEENKQVMRTDLTLIEICFILERSYDSVRSQRQRLGFMKQLCATVSPPQPPPVYSASLNPAERRIMSGVYSMVGRGASLREGAEKILAKYGTNDDSLARQVVLTALTMEKKPPTPRVDQRTTTESLQKLFSLEQRSGLDGAALEYWLHKLCVAIKRIKGHATNTPRQLETLARLEKSLDSLLQEMES